ncbi:MAG: DUF488 domain-containing protein [Acidobacteriaceae bacterium]|nr:DUF488 domain-containing protein [Acidobacteriaceae bacterium]
MIKLKRARDEAEPGDGARYLVDRLWPRGVAKASLKMDGWLKDAAPSNELRHEFHHDPAKWDEFRRRYFAELDANPEAWKPLLEAAGKGTVTLMYDAHDPEHNNAVALAEYLKKHAPRK